MLVGFSVALPVCQECQLRVLLVMVLIFGL